jgi:hypothetical protein
MGTKLPRELTGTAVAKPGDTDSQLKAFELANLRLQTAAEKLGVFIGQPTFQEIVHANGRAGGHDIVIVTAPVLDTGTDEKVDHTRRPDEQDQQ